MVDSTRDKAISSPLLETKVCWRRIEVSDRRTAVQLAHQIRWLVDAV